ncbi:MAG: hypothetical protein ACOX3T_07100 [Bdellovibrionota bacterium]|jgi:hypothetical protein
MFEVIFKVKFKNVFKKFILLAFLSMCFSGCYALQNIFNPFYEPPTEHALKGELSDLAIQEGTTSTGSSARDALESMATYQRAHLPQPNNPVMRPAVVRLMWIPDHLNTHGDLVPAHYYYLKVLSERWAVTDAFDLERQLNTGSKDTSNIPYISQTENKGYN